MGGIINEVKGVGKEGKGVVGVCNGLEILREIGLVGGGLVDNDCDVLISRNESLKIVNNESGFSDLYEGNEEVVYGVGDGEGD
ncbi:type 1 glutamine amidotransferase family protein [Staphylococcus capitis]|uniref:hypothetical protein n=1 Tax=Staphylococcus capitis TaxID=29388 RepID=UPI0011A29B6E|nr:hypothetical protein [Staphylococcus capitis]